MDNEAEPKQLLKKSSKGKVFRNISLISILVVIVSFIILFGTNLLTGKAHSDFIANIFIFIVIFSAIIGGTSFLIWIFSLINKRGIEKPYRRKIFRNIWLISTLVFALLFVAIVVCAMTYNDSLLGLVLIPLILSTVVGGLSFLIWIFVPSNKSFPKFLRIIDILFGIILALWFALTIRCIAYIYLYDTGLGDTLYDLLFTVLAFSLVCFAWIKIKTRKILFKSAIVLIVIGTYFFGRVYAVREYQSFQDAMAIFTQANSDEGYAWTKETDPVKYMNGVRGYVASLKLAFDTAKPSLRWGKTYFENYYLLKNKLLGYDERINSGDLKLTEIEADILINESNDQVKTLDQQGYMLPFWTDFFMVK